MMSHSESDQKRGFKDFKDSRVISLLFLGFSAGLPLLLIFGSLSLWLREAGMSRSSVTYFSWAALAYSFKFVWAPLVDKLPLPVLKSIFGQRRSWLLLAQFGIALAMVIMAMSDPAYENGLKTMVIGVVLLGFMSATQDIVIDAYRIEVADVNLQALMASTYVAGYRIGMIVAGAVALYLADFFGSTDTQYLYSAWQKTYLVMAACMSIGVVTSLLIKEPVSQSTSKYLHSPYDYLRFIFMFLVFVASFISAFIMLSALSEQIIIILGESTNSALSGFIAASTRLLSALSIAIGCIYLMSKLNIAPKQMIDDTYLAPIVDFFNRYHKQALVILLLVGLYRISDIVLGAVANIFYQDMGFSKSDIATVTKVFGLWMTILGGFLGGYLSLRFGVMRILMLGAFMTIATNLMFIWLAQHPGDFAILYVVVGADNITAGLASAAFIAYLSSLVNLSFTATQYAILSSLMTLFPKIIAGYSGSMVDGLGYETFFLLSSLLGIPAILLIILISRKAPLQRS